jgi:hypothetical protein
MAQQKRICRIFFREGDKLLVRAVSGRQIADTDDESDDVE